MSLLAEVERLLRSGREQIASHGRIVGQTADGVRNVYGRRLDPLEAEIAAAYDRGARKGRRDVGGVGRGDLVGRTAFPHARQRTLNLLTDLAAEQRRVLVLVDRHAYIHRLSPSRRLDLVRAAGGLNWRQAQALIKRHELLIAQGFTANVRRSLITHVGNRMRLQRARMIARTEAAVAENIGREDVWRQARDRGLIASSARRVWVTALDERTCPTCSALDGVSIPLDGAWDSSGVAVATPGAVHPHCRCSERLEDGPLLRVA
jgi:hypothetical protein